MPPCHIGREAAAAEKDAGAELRRAAKAEIAIKAAEHGDDVPLKSMLEVVRSPFEERAEWSAYAGEAPAWGRCLEISCSS